LAADAMAVNWLRDAYAHLKAIGLSEGSDDLIKTASIKIDKAVLSLNQKQGVEAFIVGAKKGRFWDREPKLKSA